MRAVEGRWKIFIVFHLLGGTMRFAVLQRAINETNSRTITPKMLTQELREMEADGLIHREVYPQVPPKVEYSLTSLGRDLQPVVEAMSAWGRQAHVLANGNGTATVTTSEPERTSRVASISSATSRGSSTT